MFLHNLPLMIALAAMVLAASLFAMLQFGGNESRQAILGGFGLLALAAVGLSVAMGDRLFQAGASETSAKPMFGMMADDLLPVQPGAKATGAMMAIGTGKASGPALAMNDRGYVRSVAPTTQTVGPTNARAFASR